MDDSGPRASVEELVRGIWVDVLKVRQVGAHDDFFSLGGQSLLATQVLARLEREVGVPLALGAFLDEPTVAGLVKQVKGAATVEPPRSPAVELRARTRDAGDALPLSFAQERLWFLDQLAPDSARYNVPALLRLHGALDERAFARALADVIARHESLRTTFTAIGGIPAQVVAPAGAVVALRRIDLTAIPAASRVTEGWAIASEEVRRPFDLKAGPLIRAMLLSYTEDEHVVVLVMHHIVSDGWSRGILFHELLGRYDAHRAPGTPVPLAALALQYPDYVLWQREYLTGDRMEHLLQYWRRRLAEAPAVLTLPTDRPRAAIQSHRGAIHTSTLPADLVTRLGHLTRTEGATLFMGLLAGFKILLRRYGASSDVVVGSAVAGRSRPELEGLIGLFVNTLALRTSLAGNPTVRELLHRVRETTLGAYEHQDLPFEKLVQVLQPDRSLGHAPLVQVLLTLHDTPDGGRNLAGVVDRPPELHPGTALADLALTLTDKAGELHCTWEYSTDLFDATTIERLASHYAAVLTGAVSNADRRISQIPLLTPQEKAHLLAVGTAVSAHTSG